MPALRKVLKFLINVVPFVIFTALTLFSQTGLDDVHVATRQTLPNQRGASSVELENSGIHVIHTDSRLVLVPVSVTDPMQRFVTGLNRDNFEVFEGAKPQTIQHFSSEDVPVSLGIILDVSGSAMKTPIDVVKALRDARGQGKRVALARVRSNEATRYIAIPVG